MSKKTRIKLISIAGILLVSIVIVSIVLMSIRSEFVSYLDTKYPGLPFKVGFAKIDIIYGKYYANVTCLNDGTFFTISKSFKSKDIYENYPQYKSNIQYNSKIKNIFDDSDIQRDIKSVTGGGKIHFESDAAYEQINIHINDEADHISVAKKVLNILTERNISAEKIIFTYEKDKGVYELWLSSNDYNITEKDIESKVKKVK